MEQTQFRAAPADVATSSISLRGVSKTFGPVRAVHDLDLEIRQGEVVAFLGPNGAGKTSTIDMILGLSAPSTGEVRVLGMEPHEAIRRGLVAAVMQTGGLLKDLTVAETVAYTASLFPTTAPVADVLARAGIAEIGDRLVGKCSGGAPVRDGAAAGPGAAAARRADHRHGCRGPAGVLGRDPQ